MSSLQTPAPSAALNTLQSWLLAFRPKTLTAAVIPVCVGVSLGASMTGQAPQWTLALWAILSSMCIQIATNLVNDALDFKKGTDTKNRLGPVRVSASGLISPAQVMMGAFVFFALAAVFAIPLIQARGLFILTIGLVSILAGYVYTGGPFPLAYHGLGDVFVVLFFGLVSVSGSFFLQTGTFSNASIVAGLQVGFLATVLIAINNLRDIMEDARNQKNTLAVRFGTKFVRREVFLLNAVTLLLCFYWRSRGFTLWALPMVVAPLMIWVTSNVYKTKPSKVYNLFLAQAALVHLLFGLLCVVAFSAGFKSL